MLERVPHPAAAHTELEALPQAMLDKHLQDRRQAMLDRHLQDRRLQAMLDRHLQAMLDRPSPRRPPPALEELQGVLDAHGFLSELEKHPPRGSTTPPRPSAAPPDVGVPPSTTHHERCACGNAFMKESAFCHKCGAARAEGEDDDDSGPGTPPLRSSTPPQRVL